MTHENLFPLPPDSSPKIYAYSLPDVPTHSGYIKIGWTSAIPNYAFQNRAFIQSVVIPDGVISIGSGAFQGCSNLQSVTIPASVEEIKESAFDGCTNLYSVSIAGSPTLGNNAFRNVPGYSG